MDRPGSPEGGWPGPPRGHGRVRNPGGTRVFGRQRPFIGLPIRKGAPEGCLSAGPVSDKISSPAPSLIPNCPGLLNWPWVSHPLSLFLLFWFKDDCISFPPPHSIVPKEARSPPSALPLFRAGAEAGPAGPRSPARRRRGPGLRRGPAFGRRPAGRPRPASPRNAYFCAALRRRCFAGRRSFFRWPIPTSVNLSPSPVP